MAASYGAVQDPAPGKGWVQIQSRLSELSLPDFVLLLFCSPEIRYG